MGRFKNAWQHFRTISHHKVLVCRHCFKVGLYRQGIMHDLSKYSLTEFRVGVNYYQGDRSPNTAERSDLGYSTAWLHHKGRNRHHYEYWIDMKGNRDATLEGKPMPRAMWLRCSATVWRLARCIKVALIPMQARWSI